MNREKVKALLPVLIAFAEGKAIQIRVTRTGLWKDAANPAFAFDADNYRVKPEPVNVKRIGVINLEPQEGVDPWITSFPTQKDADDFIRRNSLGRKLSTFPLTGSYER